MNKKNGFTLIEVLLALMIIAIGLTALLKTSAEQIILSQRLKEKSIQHLILMNAIADVQLNAVAISLNQEITQTRQVFGKTWYWRAKLVPTTLDSVQKIIVTASSNRSGPFTNPLIGYRYHS